MMNKEVRMFRTRTNGVLLVVLALAVVFGLAACENLSVSKLRGNYYFSRANRNYTEMKYRQAIVEYEQALAANPGLTQAYRLLGESYKQLYKPAVETPENIEKRDKALVALQKAYEIDPNNKDIIYSLGDMYDKLRNFGDAEKLYLRIIDLEPSNMSNYYVIAEFYRRYAGDDPDSARKAEAMFLRRIEVDPENPLGYSYVANYFETLQPSDVNVQMAYYEKAYDYKKRIAELQPDSAEAWVGIGINRWSIAYRFQNLSTSERMRIAGVSEEALKKAMDLDPSYPESYSWLSVLYQSTLSKLDAKNEARYTAEGQKYMERYQELRKRAAEKKKLEDDLKKVGG
jgi:tetratricopeptide (TPR) repeat protein